MKTEEPTVLYKNKDVQTFEVLISQYQNQIFSYCYHLLMSRQDAEDAAQEIFFKFYQKYFPWYEALSVSPLLYKMAYNKCMDILRRRKKVLKLPLQEGQTLQNDPLDITLANMLHKNIKRGMQSLSMEDRSILFLRILEERSFDEIARIFGGKSAAMRKKYQRARERLMAKINALEGENVYDKRKSKS